MAQGDNALHRWAVKHHYAMERITWFGMACLATVLVVETVRAWLDWQGG